MVKRRKCDLCQKVIDGPIVETQTSAGARVWLCERCAVSEGLICETPTRRPGEVVVGLTKEELLLVEGLRKCGFLFQEVAAEVLAKGFRQIAGGRKGEDVKAWELKAEIMDETLAKIKALGA